MASGILMWFMRGPLHVLGILLCSVFCGVWGWVAGGACDWVVGRAGSWGVLPTWVGVDSISPLAPGHPTFICFIGINNINK